MEIKKLCDTEYKMAQKKTVLVINIPHFCETVYILQWSDQ